MERAGVQAEQGLLAIACAKIAPLDVPAFVKDSELRFVAVNAAFEAFSGFERTELIGSALSALTDRPEDRALEDMERRALVFAEEQVALCFDASARDYCRVQIERFLTEDERLFVFGVFRERPGRRKERFPHKRKSRQSQVQPLCSGPPERLQLLLEKGNRLDAALPVVPEQRAPLADFHGLLDTLPLGVLLLDAQWRIAYCNQVFRDFLAPVPLSIQVGLGFDALIDAICAYEVVNAERHRAGWQQLVAQAKEAMPSSHRLSLGETAFDINLRRNDQGGIVLLFSDVTALQAVERESRLYRSVLENVPEPVFLRDAQRRLLFANQPYEQMLGGDRERFYGLREDEMFSEGADQMRLLNIQVLQDGHDLESEQLLTMPNGKEVPVLTSLRRIEADDGGPYIVGSLADISLLKVRETEIVSARIEAEALYQRLDGMLRMMPVGVVIVDADMTVSFFNSKALEIVEWPADRAFQGIRFADCIRHAVQKGWPVDEGMDAETFVLHRCSQLSNLKGTQQFERMLLDGRYILVSMTALENGQRLLTYSDYTEQRQREQEMIEAKARLENVGTLLKEATQVMKQGLCVFQEGRVLYANEQLAEMLDLPASMVVEGTDWSQVYEHCTTHGLLGDDPAAVLANVRACTHEGKNFSTTVLQRSGHWLRVDVLVSGSRRRLVVLSDVTEDKKREAELTMLAREAEAADRAKSRFLANMGHEIRTPMSGVLGMAELLAASELDTRQKTFVDVILKSGRSLLTIINDILDFARIDERSLSLRKVPFDPAAAVQDVLLLMAGRAAEKDIALLVRGTDRLTCLVAADAGRFRQILTKLLDEAIRSTDRGHVLVDISEQKESDDLLWLTMRIEDTGRGFTPEQHQKAFSMVSQPESAALHHNASAGLSLSIAGGLVALFGGTITMDSAPGKGALVTVRLPLTIASAKIADRPSPHLQGACIMALADHPLACSLLQEQLLHWGCDGVGVTDPELAWTVMGEASAIGQPIELLIVDLHGAGNGMVNLIRQVRQSPLLNTMAIIVLLGANRRAFEAKLEGLGIQAFLQKPVADTSLRTLIADVLRAGRRTRAAADVAMVPVKAEEEQTARIVMVNANEAECDFVRQVMAKERLACSVFANEEQAYTVWQRDTSPVMLIDMTQDVRAALDFVRFLRCEEAQRPDAVPTALIGLSGIVSTQERAAYLEAGLDALLIKPLNAARLVTCVRQWLTQEPPEQRLAL